MEKFTHKNKMVDLIKTNYHLLPVINRFGIKPGFKDKTVENICDELHIDGNFFLAIVNTFHSEEYFPEMDYQSFSPLLIIDYLRKTHDYYILYVVPKLENILSQLISNSESKTRELNAIDGFYKKYKAELLRHVKDEEERVFPYVINLVNNKTRDQKYSINIFEKDHSNIETEITDLKNLMLKYIEPVYDENLCNEFLIALFRFEKDVRDHARIENKILIPLVADLERKIHE